MKTGLNKRAGIIGSQFVKPITHAGSPYAEEAASKAMGLMGVPRVPVKAERLESGEMAAVSPALPMTPLHDTRPEHIPELLDPDRTARLMFSDFVMGAGDRHSGNYGHVPGQGVLSIDHGNTWHAANAWWPRISEGQPLEGFGQLSQNPDYWSEHPGHSALSELHRLLSFKDGSHPSTFPIPQDVVDNALKHRDELEQLAYEGTRDLPEEERKLAQLAVRLRLKHIEQNRPRTIDDLQSLHHAVTQEAAKTFGGRPR